MGEFMPYPQFLLFGDSLIQFSNQWQDGFCFSAALERRYERRLDVVNRGMSGYNTDQALKLIPRIIDKPENGPIKYILLLWGANDACLPTSSSGQHVPLDRYKQNLKDIINHPLIAAHDPKIILVCPPPVDAARCLAADALKDVTEVRREAAHTAEYCKAAKLVGEAELGERGVVVDLWTTILENVTGHPAPFEDKNGNLPGSRSLGQCEALVELLHDGLHMTAKGYMVFYGEVAKAMEEKWPEDFPVPEKMAMVHPPWAEAFK